jgi:hypothetical protein
MKAPLLMTGPGLLASAPLGRRVGHLFCRPLAPPPRPSPSRRFPPPPARPHRRPP